MAGGGVAMAGRSRVEGGAAGGGKSENDMAMASGKCKKASSVTAPLAASIPAAAAWHENNGIW